VRKSLIAIGVAALAVTPAVALAGSTPVKKTVKVGDYYLAPTKLTVPKGSTITWKWQAENGDSHDVKLKKGPSGVKRFRSDIASTDYSYKRRLTVAGKYIVYCTLHPTLMTQTIVVK
jgi:plastocyanin